MLKVQKPLLNASRKTYITCVAFNRLSGEITIINSIPWQLRVIIINRNVEVVSFYYRNVSIVGIEWWHEHCVYSYVVTSVLVIGGVNKGCGVEKQIAGLCSTFQCYVVCWFLITKFILHENVKYKCFNFCIYLFYR